MQKTFYRSVHAFNVGQFHLASSVDESNGIARAAFGPVLCEIKLGAGFEEATLRKVIDQLNHGQGPEPHSFVQKTLHERLQAAFKTTDMYPGIDYIQIRLKANEAASAPEERPALLAA